MSIDASIKSTDPLIALIDETTIELRSLEDQIRKARDKGAAERLRSRKLLLERRYRNLKKILDDRRNAALELRKLMEVRSRQMLSPGNGIETAAFVKGR